MESHDKTGRSATAGLALGALGVVFGDIGTSPLYALKQTFFQQVYPLDRSSQNVLGALSLFFWSIALVVTVKYIFTVMRADNNGEGGIFALLGLLRKNGNTARPKKNARWSWKHTVLPTMIVVGAALLYADGAITPAISVLSAYEGLEVASDSFKSSVIPMTMMTLFVLFVIQKRGTEKIGKLFGPIMVVWFVSIGVLGAVQIYQHPEVMQSINPMYAVRFIIYHGWSSLVILGAVVLCITGGEALYADMGHFGARAIRLAWFSICYPALLLNYFGQGAKLLSGEEIPHDNLFYALVPDALVIPMVALATAATIIASQALISGAFSLTQQAIALGLFPRLRIVHTSERQEGQIYVPFVNWVLFVGCIMLVKSFEKSDALGAAYGIAVTGTMGITTLAFGQVAIDNLHWPRKFVVPLCAALVSIDVVFFVSNALKFFHGGNIPVVVALCIFTVMATWQWGRRLIAEAYESVDEQKTLEDLLRSRDDAQLLNRAMVFLTSRKVTEFSDLLPPVFMTFWNSNGAIPKRLMFLTVVQERTPYVQGKRHELHKLDAFVVSLVVRYGYMERPNLRELLSELVSNGELKTQGDRWEFVAGTERILPADELLVRVLTALFRFILKVAEPAHVYFGLHDDAGVFHMNIPVTFGKEPKVHEVVKDAPLVAAYTTASGGEGRGA